MDRESLLNAINSEIDKNGGAFSMTKHDVAVFCYNFGIKMSKQEYQLHNEGCNPTEPFPDFDKLLIKDLKNINVNG